MLYDVPPSGWLVKCAGRRVEKEIERLAVDVRADFLRIVDMIELFGLPEIHEPEVKHLRGKLWEMRMEGKDGIARAAYVTAEGKRVIVLHVFTKKTQRTPQDAIDLALKRGKEFGYL